MSPVLTPTLLDPIAETLELNETELARLFGVSRQAVGQWRERGVPSNRMAKVTTAAAASRSTASCQGCRVVTAAST